MRLNKFRRRNIIRDTSHDWNFASNPHTHHFAKVRRHQTGRRGWWTYSTTTTHVYPFASADFDRFVSQSVLQTFGGKDLAGGRFHLTPTPVAHSDSVVLNAVETLSVFFWLQDASPYHSGWSAQANIVTDMASRFALRSKPTQTSLVRGLHDPSVKTRSFNGRAFVEHATVLAPHRASYVARSRQSSEIGS